MLFRMLVSYFFLLENMSEASFTVRFPPKHRNFMLENEMYSQSENRV